MIRLILGRAVAACALVLAPGRAAYAEDDIFKLGRIEEITVSSHRMNADNMSQGVLSAEEIYKYNALTLDHALDYIPGAASSNSGGSRNERLIAVRGFDRFQVPLSIDGIRVYLPADNRLDFGMFLTADLAEIQVQKGYVSVLDGPGGMGGAVNLVTKSPTKAFEWEARSGILVGGNGYYNGANAYISAGSKQDRFYVRASGAVADQSRWSLSDKYTPTAAENGGFRDHSSSRNWRVNLKAGLTPNDTDEYSISYTTQSGRKEAPFSVSDTVASQRDWVWPYWDVQSVYFLSSTQIGPNARLKVKAYYNALQNQINSYDNANYNTQTLPKAFISPYDDYALGGSVEGDYDVSDRDTLKASFFYRKDDHKETQTIFSPFRFDEPIQQSTEDTMSVAVENRFHVTPSLDFVTGGSYDWRHLIRANDYIDPTATVPGSFVYYPLVDNHAWNGQAALIYTFGDGGDIYANVSSRTRFPTLFDRFSSRFGGAISNPSLKTERATNYEIGGGETFGNTRMKASVYYSDVKDVIVSVPFVFNATNVTQSRNVGNADFYGGELSVDQKFSEALDAGVRYTYNKRTINNPVNPLFQLTGVPSHQVFAYLNWHALPSLTLTPSILAASDRWTVTTNGLTYFRTGHFTQANLEAVWQVTDQVDIVVGGRNLFDSNYQLTAGFPEEGRNFFLNLRLKSR